MQNVIVFMGDSCPLKWKGAVVLEGRRADSWLYDGVLDDGATKKRRTSTFIALAATESMDTAAMLHRRFGYLNCADFKRLH